MKRGGVVDPVRKIACVQAHCGNEAVVSKLNVLDMTVTHDFRRIHSGNRHCPHLLAAHDVQILNLESRRNPVYHQAVSDFASRSCSDVNDDGLTGPKRPSGNHTAIRRVHRPAHFDNIASCRGLLRRIARKRKLDIKRASRGIADLDAGREFGRR